MTMTNQFAVNQRVTFDDPHYGPQKGTVLGILPDIRSGRSTAVIEVDFALPGAVWHVPLIEIFPAAD